MTFLSFLKVKILLISTLLTSWSFGNDGFSFKKLIPLLPPVQKKDMLNAPAPMLYFLPPQSPAGTTKNATSSRKTSLSQKSTLPKATTTIHRAPPTPRPQTPPTTKIPNLPSPLSNPLPLPDPRVIMEATSSIGIPSSTTLAASTTSPSPLNFEVINISARNALVNILCGTENQTILPGITGSGIVIDPRGIILTNAHIAQYLLLETEDGESFGECIIRAGNPARPAYQSHLLYLPPSWVEKHATNLIEITPKGTGEDDYAFLSISDTFPGHATSSLAFAEVLATHNPSPGEIVLVTAYPAGFLGSILINQNLFPVSSITAIKDTFSFDGFNEEFLELEGTVVAQKGSSGGGVFDSSGHLVGLVATVSSGTTTNERHLGAISMFHINKSLLVNTGATLEQFLMGDIQSKATQYDSLIAPRLKDMLSSSIFNR